MLDNRQLVILGGAILAVGLAAAYFIREPGDEVASLTDTAPRPPPDVTPPVRPVESASLVPVGRLVYRANKTVILDAFGSYPRFEASPGAIIVAVDYSVVNGSDEQIAVSDIAEPSIFVEGGAPLQPDPATTDRLRAVYSTYSSPPALLGPGVTLRTVVGYEIAPTRFWGRQWLLDFGGDANPRLPAPTKSGG